MIHAGLKGEPVAWFAPTYKMLAQVWRDLQHVAHPIVKSLSVQERRMDLLTGGSIEFWSVDNPNSGRGRKYGLVILDEAATIRDLKDVWLAAIRPTLTDLRGTALFLSTPKGRNYFHELFTKGQAGEPDWKSWRFLSRDNPRMSAEEIESAKRDLPEQIFRQEYEGIPADDGGNPFGLSAIRACIAAALSADEPAAWGLDLAKSSDWTVAIALDDDGYVCRFERWQAPWQQTIDRCRSLIDAYCLVDSTGVGDPVLEALQQGRQNFEGFKFSQTSKQQLMEGLAVGIQRGEVRFPEGPIVTELESFEYEYTPSGVHYSAPQGLHDDCVCALALARQCWTNRRVPIASPISIEQPRQFGGWKV